MKYLLFFIRNPEHIALILIAIFSDWIGWVIGAFYLLGWAMAIIDAWFGRKYGESHEK